MSRQSYPIPTADIRTSRPRCNRARRGPPASRAGGRFLAGSFIVCVLAAGVACLAGAKAPAPGTSWHQWRGPNRDGISQEKGWRTDWPKAGPKRLWKATVGVGFSSVSVRDGRVYTMGHAKGVDTVYCLRADTGRVIWKHPYPCEPARSNPGPRATPTLDGKAVYAFSSAGHIMSLAAETGKPNWSKNIQQELKAGPARWGLSGSPLVVGKLLVLNAGNGGVALDKATGKVVWQFASRGGPSYSSPVLFRMGTRQCVALMGGREIVAAALADGKVLWRHPWEPSFPNNCADPIFSGDRVFLSSAYAAGCALLRFKGGSTKVVWKNKEMNNHFSSCVLVGGLLYGFDGDVRQGRTSLKCMDFDTGKVKWATKLKGSLLAADGKLIILTTSGELIVAQASAEGYKQLARAKVLSGKCWTPPVLAGGRIFCRSHEGDLVCVDVKGARP